MDITSKQTERFNRGVKNGFSLDLKHYIQTGDKRLIKGVLLKDGRTVRCAIDYEKEKDSEKNRVVLQLSLWSVPTEDGTINTNGKVATIKTEGFPLVKRKSLDLLKTVSGFVTDDDIMTNYNTKKDILKDDAE